LIAGFLGTGPVADAFFAAFKFPNRHALAHVCDRAGLCGRPR
jgi:hypothetical protein